ncbi:hypothetical protein K144316041_18020 [Clostridium tetani]|nr:hypothetical protein K144316041_18020 [Clostridium tetani]
MGISAIASTNLSLYRRKEIYGEKKKEIGKILRMLCEWKGVEIIEANACKDHIYMLVSILQEDIEYEQISLKEYVDTFTCGHDLFYTSVCIFPLKEI